MGVLYLILDLKSPAWIFNFQLAANLLCRCAEKFRKVAESVPVTILWFLARAIPPSCGLSAIVLVVVCVYEGDFNPDACFSVLWKKEEDASNCVLCTSFVASLRQMSNSRSTSSTTCQMVNSSQFGRKTHTRKCHSQPVMSIFDGFLHKSARNCLANNVEKSKMADTQLTYLRTYQNTLFDQSQPARHFT